MSRKAVLAWRTQRVAPSPSLEELYVIPKFEVGDRVERIIGRLLPEHVRHGVVTRVIPNRFDFMAEYEVKFDNRVSAKFYETQLRLISRKDSEA
jgi:hypothetical protein